MILTGFAYNQQSNIEKNREATETIQTVIAKYSQSSDYSYFRNQVGAIIASLDTSITYTNQKSINQNYNLKVEENQNISPGNTIKVTSMQTNEIQKQEQIRSATDVVPFLSIFAQDEVENFGVITLDNAHKVKEVRVVSVGTINSSLVHPREVFKEAIRTNAASLILFHNPPSGSLEPSKNDLEVTKQLLKAAEITGIKILDHIIVSPEGYMSFEEEYLLYSLKPRSSFMKNSDITTLFQFLNIQQNVPSKKNCYCDGRQTKKRATICGSCHLIPFVTGGRTLKRLFYLIRRSLFYFLFIFTLNINNTSRSFVENTSI